MIIAMVDMAFRQAEKILVLTERIDPMRAIEERLAGREGNMLTLHGLLSKTQWAALVAG